jgi:hypothetical protein
MTNRMVVGGWSPGLTKALTMKDDVFISARSTDYQYAIQVYQYLTGLGVRTFFSRESLPELGNSDYRKEIDKKLDEVQHLVVVVSSAENAKSPWVEAEWGFFINEKRSGRKMGNLITVTVGSLEPRDLPASLRYHEVIPFGPEAFEKIAHYVSSSSPPKNVNAEPLAAVDEGSLKQQHLPDQAIAGRSTHATWRSYFNCAAVNLRRMPWRSALLAVVIIFSLGTYWFWYDISARLYPPSPPEQLPNLADYFPSAEELERPPAVPPKDVTFSVFNDTNRDLLLLMVNCETARRGMKEKINPFQPGPLALTGKMKIAAGDGATKNDFRYGNGWFVFYVYDSRRGWLPYAENGRAIGAKNIYSHQRMLLTITLSTDWRFPYVWTFTPDASLPKSGDAP